MRSPHWIVACASAALLLASCGRGEQRPAPQQRPAAPSAPRTIAPSPVVSAATYVETASSIDLFEIRSSELALQRSTSARVREFAAMMITAHKGTSGQLSLAGRRLNLLPSARLNARHQAMLDELAAAADFDATYRRQQLAVHQEARSLHASYASRGASPTLRPVAAAILPVVERHLRLLRYL